MHIIHLFSCENSGVIPVIFILKLKNKNSGARFRESLHQNSAFLQERSIPVKCNANP